MAGKINFVDGGSVTTPRGFSAGATYAGLKTYAEDKLDLGYCCSPTGPALPRVCSPPAQLSPLQSCSPGSVSPRVS